MYEMFDLVRCRNISKGKGIPLNSMEVSKPVLKKLPELMKNNSITIKLHYMYLHD